MMKRIFLDAELRAKLVDLSQPLELCDASGHVLASVFPAVPLSDYDLWEPPYDEEELHRLEQSNERRYSTAELLDHLRAL
jgi:hypothetical protein